MVSLPWDIQAGVEVESFLERPYDLFFFLVGLGHPLSVLGHKYTQRVKLAVETHWEACTSVQSTENATTLSIYA